ncbi:MAG: creatininase family protein [Firmicutes bacterium]|nr:creatininase family protein [Bacillota bacterium]MCL5971598.1 creatininase family protein [Bacillota bacterium]
MINLLESSWTDIAAIDGDRRVLVMVIGPTEQHGPHLPLGTDIFAAEEMARQVVTVLEEECGKVAVKAPPLYFTPAVLSRLFPGSVSIRKKHYHDFLKDILSAYAGNGLTQAVLVSSHIDPPFVETTQRVCTVINQEFGARYINGYERFPLQDVATGQAELLFGYGKPGDVHAGLMETSNIMHIRPELVKIQVTASLEDAPLSFESMAQLRSLRDFGMGLGYVGYPAEANARYGKMWFERYATMFADVIRRYCRGEDVDDQLSIIPILEQLQDQ